jgi:phosphate starvation-inducible PhoH-like protein
MSKSRKRSNQRVEVSDVVVDEHHVREARVVKPLSGKTANQVSYIKAIKANTLVFATGPAGTGKTYIAAGLAADALRKDPDLSLIVTRPVVEAGEQLGFLPGTLEEKFAPYLEPFLQVLQERLGAGEVKYMLKHGRINPKPLAYMRGTTFRDCYVILDEAQNTTPTQMKLFLTRIGENSKVIVDGDVDQVDVRGVNGLSDAIQRMEGVPDVAMIEFTEDDIVRHDIVRHIIKAYRR